MIIEMEEHIVEMQGDAYVARLARESDAWWTNVYRNILIKKLSPLEAMAIFRAGRKYLDRKARYDKWDFLNYIK